MEILSFPSLLNMKEQQIPPPPRFSTESANERIFVKGSQAVPVAQMVKNLPAMQETWLPSTQASVLIWKVPQTEEPAGTELLKSHSPSGHMFIPFIYRHLFSHSFHW